MTLTLIHRKMFGVGGLPVMTFGNCVLMTGMIKWRLKLRTFLRFFYFLHFFKIVFELLHTFSRTLLTTKKVSSDTGIRAQNVGPRVSDVLPRCHDDVT